ncbi:MAG: helix-turn-helix domain-containing protein [Phycisphaeraceae bacterium]|nr:helix-turn-helix domain-containing protein [Phycisphaeraceae bacterium]
MDDIRDNRKASTVPVLAMRAKDAAKALGVSERTLWTWTKAGTIPHLRRGGTILYPTAALTKWLNDQAAHAQTVNDGVSTNVNSIDDINNHG